MKTDFFRLSLGPKMREIADTYGEDAARFMVDTFAGCRCYMVPMRLKRGRREWQALADFLGPKKTEQFEFEYSGVKIYIPLGERQAIRDRYEAIYHDYKEYSRTGIFKNDKLEFPMNPTVDEVIEALATVHKRSKSSIKRIIKTMKEEEKKEGK